MENLKFSAQYSTDDTGEDASDSIEIYTINRRNIKYNCIVDDFEECQEPSPMLKPMACRKFIVDNIKEATYVYHPDTDIVTVSMVVISKMCNIVIELVRVESKSTLEDRVSFLEAALERLEPYEVIHSHVYPKWNSIEEFKALSDFKYFEAYVNRDSYYKEYKDSSGKVCTDSSGKVCKYLGISNIRGLDYYYNHNGGPGRNLKDNPGQREHGHMIEGLLEHIGSLETNDGCDRQLIRLIDPKNGICNLTSYFDIYVKSLSTLVPKQYNPSIFLLEYIQDYIAGWVLLHHNLISFRDAKLQIIIKDNRCVFNIFRKKVMDITDLSGSNQNIITSASIKIEYVMFGDVIRRHIYW